MIISRKIRIIPTPQQETQFWQSAGTSRWAYNYFLRTVESHHEATNEWLTDITVRRELTILKKTDAYRWLNDVGSNVPKQAMKDAYDGYKRWFKKLGNKPKPKVKFISTPSFYLNYESFKATEYGFKGEKFKDIIKTSEPLPVLKDGCLYKDPRVTHDGLYWYLSISYKEEDLVIDQEVYELTDQVLGIDVGISVLAYCSDDTAFSNINKSNKIKVLEKRLKREQRKLSRKLQANIKDYESVIGKDGKYYKKPIYDKPLDECNNIKKQRKVVKRLYQKLTNIRNNYIHQVSRQIVNKKPNTIVMEDLNIKGMMKNKHISKAIADQKLYFLKMQIKQKAERMGIEFINADRFYASSKICYHCKNKKNNLTLSNRAYICEHCGFTINRDYNASLNLASLAI